jgi:hypothetical protein
VRAGRFTEAEATPSIAPSLRSTLAAQPAHIIPNTAIVFFSINYLFFTYNIPLQTVFHAIITGRKRT